MKKKVLAAMLVAAMTATMFAGCGSKDNGASNDGTQAANNGSTSESAEPVDVKLTVMGPSEDQDDAQGAWLKTECEAFNEEHPEWNITFDYVTCSESDAKDTVLQDPASAADVYMFANDQIADLVDAGALTKLGGDAAEYVKSSNSEAMAATVTYNGDIFPFMRTYIENLTERSYQNRTIGLIENGSWAPAAARIMQGMFEKSKNITWLENNVKITSSLSEANEAEIDAMAEELCK